jgi:CubicO group peptidase (beta-lactamase class C family)
MTLTRRAALVTGATLLALPRRLIAAPPLPGPSLATLANAAIAQHLTPGISIAALGPNHPLRAEAYGAADLENPTPMRPNAVCKIGSLTKQFTAAAILKLAEAKTLVIDDKIARFFPNFPRAEAITLRHLLTHTAGLGNYTNTPQPEDFLQNARRDYTGAQMLQVILDAEPLFLFPPGAAFSYSNSGYVLLGLIIAKVTGASYHDAMRTLLFQPLGLTNTAVDDMAELVPNRACGYSPDPLSPAGFDNASFISMTYPGGAGSIRSTASDLCIWARALLGGRVLQTASLQAMLTPGRLANGNLPHELGPTGKIREIRYGFGVIVEQQAGKRVVMHNGGIQGFSSLLRSVVDDQTSVAVLCNSDGGPELRQAMAHMAEAVLL